MKKNYSAIIVSIITFFIYAITTTPDIKRVIFYLFHFYIFFSIGGLAYYFWIRHHRLKTKTIPIVLYIITSTMLLWVGMTNWFFSPFFYFVYILAIIFAFIFSVRTTIAFTGTLCFIYIYLFSSNDIFLDLLMIISFTIVIPISFYLQRSFLYLKQKEKQILILREDLKKQKNPVKDFLVNKVDRLTVEIRQPASDIKQLAKHSTKLSNKTKIVHNLQKMMALSDNIIKDIDHFERKTTGKRIVKTK